MFARWEPNYNCTQNLDFSSESKPYVETFLH